MRTLLAVLFVFVSGCEGCGYTSVDNKMTGQVKKIHHNTPIVCENYISADVSLGVMQNGVGSISSHDVQMTIEDQKVMLVMEKAASTGKLVEITFKERRVTVCIDGYIVTSAKLLDDPGKPQAASARSVVVDVDGHSISALVDDDRVSNLHVDGVSTDPASPTGKVAIEKLGAGVSNSVGAK